MTPIYYDTETTGVRTDKDRIIEIAAFNPITGDTFVSFVNPGMSIPPESTAISNITNEMVKDAPFFHQIAPKFFEFCGEMAVLIAHNNDTFDKVILTNECKRENLTLPSFRYIDTLKWARKYRPDLPKHSLQYLREIYCIAENTAHRALDDVMVLYQIFSKMVDNLPLTTIMDLLSQKESPIKIMPFGKHKGSPLSKVPPTYIKWLNESGAFDKSENEKLKLSLIELGILTV
ncbi:MAG: DUF3820 family protein [Chlamydiales bacterium]|nr:DUF3820 family protein [Chlamydiales bacterium]